MSAAVHWYPGHMAKAMRRLTEDLCVVDVVIEAIDGRIPQTGANPALAQAAGGKPRLLVLTRADLADPHGTKAWLAHFARMQQPAVAIDAKHRSGIVRLREELANLPGRRAVMRAMIVGVPNAGKSTVINALAKRNAAKAEDRAGVTRAQQWIRVSPRLELLDTAGILPTRVERPDDSWKLAVASAVPRALFDAEDVVRHFVEWDNARARTAAAPDLESFARSRGLLRGETLDVHNAAWSYLKALGEGGFGRYTFDEVPS